MEKQRWEESGRRREAVRRSERRKSEKKEEAGARKGRKVAIHFVFPMICGSGWSKSRLAKAAGAEPAGQMRDEKLHAVVARSTFPSQNAQNAQNTPTSDHFWKLRCRKSARRCGAKHISKSKVSKHEGFGPLFDVQLSKKCMPLQRETHFEIKSVKNCGVRTAFGRSDVVLPGMRTGFSTLWKVSKAWGFVAVSTTTTQYSTLHHTRLHYTTRHYNTFNYITLQLHLQLQLHYNYNYSTTTKTTTTTTTTTTTATATTATKNDNNDNNNNNDDDDYNNNYYYYDDDYYYYYHHHYYYYYHYYYYNNNYYYYYNYYYNYKYNYKYNYNYNTTTTTTLQLHHTTRH